MVLSRKAAEAARLAIKYQDLSSEDEEAEEAENKGSSSGARSRDGTLRQTPRPKQTYGKGKKRARASKEDMHTSSPETRGRKSTTSLRTPLKCERSVMSKSISIPYTPLKSSASLRDLMDDLLPTTASVLTQPTTPQNGLSSPAPPAPLVNVPDVWSFASLGSFVWVRIDRTGNVFEEEGQEEETYWWPAKILRSMMSVPLEVSFFGTISEHAPSKAWIPSPSSNNILSMMLPNGVVRFNQHNYIQVDSSSSSTTTQNSPSPRKKLHTEIGRRWSDAADAMIAADADDNGGLSARLSGFSGVRSVTSTKRHVNLSPMSSLSDDEYDGLMDNDFEADPMLKIPGELVLARESRPKTEYWPAQVIEYIPPKHSYRKTKPRYRLMFLDGKQKTAERDWFFASYQEGFQTCKLGEFRSDKPLDHNGNDDTDSETDEHQRPPSPVPVDPPLPAAAFCKLNLHEQFAYVKHVLVAILNERYGPATNRHQKFMHGGSARAKLDRDAGLKGHMTGQEVSRLTKMLTRWVLREKGKAELIRIDGQEYAQNSGGSVKDEDSQSLTSLSDPPRPPSPFVPPSGGSKNRIDGVVAQEHVAKEPPPKVTSNPHPPRQQGCSAYERLTDHEKLDYCTNILVPEAVIQILLWRAGKRVSVAVLSDEEEERLHETGLELAHQLDWVNEIMQLRKAIGRSAQASDKPGELTMVGGTNTRPKLKSGK